MAVIPNKWVKKDKPKSKASSKAKDESKHVPSLINTNMHKTLRGVRK